MKNKLHPSDRNIMWDCDDTLVMWDVPNLPYELMSFEDQVMMDKDDIVAVKDPYASKPGEDPVYINLRKHHKHIKLLKDHHARGFSNIIWSAGGYEWAQEVVNALQLNDYVDIIMAKPLKYVDDLKAEEILVSRIYLNCSKKGLPENE